MYTKMYHKLCDMPCDSQFKLEDNMGILTIMAVLLLLLITGIAVFITIEMYLKKME